MRIYLGMALNNPYPGEPMITSRPSLYAAKTKRIKTVAA